MAMPQTSSLLPRPFFAEKERARDQHRAMNLELAAQHLDTSPFSWTKRTQDFFVLWSSIDGGVEEQHLTLTRLPLLTKRVRAM